MFNKRGQGLSINAIILIILAVVVLVVLILGFTIGWNKIAPWIKPSNNVDTVAQACQAACSTNSVYGFCSEIRELKASDLPGEVKKVNGNCTFFSNDAEYLKYGIDKCPGLCPSA